MTQPTEVMIQKTEVWLLRMRPLGTKSKSKKGENTMTVNDLVEQFGLQVVAGEAGLEHDLVGRVDEPVAVQVELTLAQGVEEGPEHGGQALLPAALVGKD